MEIPENNTRSDGLPLSPPPPNNHLAEPLVQVHGAMRQARQALPTAARMSQLGTESSQQSGTGQRMQEGTAGCLLVRDMS